MKINLINLPSPDLAEPWTNFPLGLGYLAAYIEDRGYDVSVSDFCCGPVDEIPEADIYGVSVTTPQYDSAIVMARRIRSANRNALIVAGGPHTIVDSGSLLADGVFNSVVRGEGEQSFLKLIRDYGNCGEVKEIYNSQPVRNLDSLHFPARHLFPDFKKNALRTHQLLRGDYAEGGQTTIIASRGCPYECSFCSPHSRRLRFRSVENVFTELRQIVEQYGIRQFKWQDDTFSANRKWTVYLCDMIRSELPKTFHRAHTRADVFDEEMALAMSKAGFKVLCFGIESFSQRLLDLNMKRITVEQIERSLAIARKYGFKTVAYMICGLPGENAESVAETKAGILRNKKNLDYMAVSTVVPFPGTPLWNDPDKFDCEILEKDWSKYWLFGHEGKDVTLVKTKGVSLEVTRRLKRDFYRFIEEEGYDRPEWESKKGEGNNE